MCQVTLFDVLRNTQSQLLINLIFNAKLQGPAIKPPDYKTILLLVTTY